MSARLRSLDLGQRRRARDDEAHASEGVELARQRHLGRLRVRLGERNAGGSRIQGASIQGSGATSYMQACRERVADRAGAGHAAHDAVPGRRLRE